MTWIIIFLFIVTSIFFLEFITSLTNLLFGNTRNCFSAILYGVLFSISLTTAVVGVNTPKAIDVYRGKTSLEITSINNIPTDTLVVWKIKYKRIIKMYEKNKSN